MTWTYSGDPSASALDELRFLIGDTDEDNQRITDEELTYLLGVHADQGASYSNYLAASAACRALAAKYASLRDKTVGSLSISYSQTYQHFLELAEQLATTSAGARKFGAPVLGGGGGTYLGGNWR